MTGNEPIVGDRVHHEGRPHPTREGWLQANGVIIRIIYADDEDHEPYEIVVQYDEDDHEVYFTEQLEWCSSIGGYWRVT